MEFEMKVLDQFINEEGSDQERMCWRKIKSAMCSGISNAVFGKVLKIIDDEYIENIYKIRSDVESLHKSLEYDGWNDALDKIKQKILSIST